MATTNVTLDDIITNLEEAITSGFLSPASRNTMNNGDLLSLLVAIRNEIRRADHTE